MELYHEKLSFVDIHPFIINEDGSAKHADSEGGFYDLKPIFLELLFFWGRTIPCISAKGQKLFHTGYELRDIDRHDIKTLEALEDRKIDEELDHV